MPGVLVTNQPDVGGTVFVEAGMPAANLGLVNDLSLDTTAYAADGTLKVWRKVLAGWVVAFEIIPGSGGGGGSGADGAPGSVFRVGTGAPSSGLGINGDLYLNSANGDVYLKAAGAYTITANIKGPQGIQGNAGSNGTNGTNGTNGVDGAAGNPVVTISLFTSRTTTGAGTSHPLVDDRFSLAASIVGTGNIACAARLQGSDDDATWSDLATITLSGNGSSSASSLLGARYLHVRAIVDTISGTGTAFTLTLTTGA